jgi:hypothetical protein
MGAGDLLMIRTGVKKVFRRLAGLVPLAALVIGPAPRLPVRTGASVWWEIELQLTTDGHYRMDENEFNAEGSYRIAVAWTGTMERDGTDFRLYRVRNDLTRWEAEERTTRPDRLVLLTAADFPEKPSFDFNFLIAKGETLVLDLTTRGFAVPVSSSPEKFYLFLPSSAENAQSAEGVAYNAGVGKGSNRVSVPAEVLLGAPFEKDYGWDWKNEQWLLREDRTVHILQGHRARLTLTIRPHHEADPEPSGDSIGFAR